MHLPRWILLFVFAICCFNAYGQQDMDLHLANTFLAGKNVLKAKRDYRDPYLWVLTKNNGVYRINSLTNDILDFSPSFSAYSGKNFIDIAGVSKDTVFVAAKDELLGLRSGVLKSVRAAHNINPSINSLGVDVAGFSNGYVTIDHALLIATNHGIYRYNTMADVMLAVPNDAPSCIYASTYRTEMLTDGEFCRCYTDTIDHVPAMELFNYTIYSAELWTGGKNFGNTIKSAYYTSGDAYDQTYLFTGLTHLFWATEEGLFENNWGYSYTTDVPHRHYLKGTDIRKIASIYGLRSFGQTVAMENLLVGSSTGLYFSNSRYRNSPDGYTSDYSFFHYDKLGNKAINDICVNAASYSSAVFNASVCEDGIWVAAADGLYLLTPDYTRTGNAIKQLKAVQFDGQDAAIDKLEICSNTTVTAIANSYVYSGKNIQWYKDGVELPNESNLTLKIKKAGDYYAKMYDPCTAVHFDSNHLNVIAVAAPVFSFNYPDKLNYCDGSAATLKTDDKANYQYRWYKDGALNGNTSATLDNITENGKYKVEVSACSGTWLASKEVLVSFIKAPQPLIKTDKPAYCAGDNAKLSATVPIDASNIINWTPYQYRWYTDGVLNGSTSADLIVNRPAVYKVEVSSCSGEWVASGGLRVDFIELEKPVITPDKPAYCIGDNALLTVNFVNDGTYSINWLRDGNLVSADKDKTSITANQPGAYTVNIGSNLTSCNVTSDENILKFDNPPDINLERIINTTLCDGATVTLKASYSGGSIKWSTGETSDQVNVKSSGLYSATVTTPGGCVLTKETNLQFFPNPVLNVPDATLCQFTNETITLTAPSGFVKYEWNGEAGSPNFSTSKLGIVNLTVTDQNGCQASQVIKINGHCKDIHIPNTFTPNGDGINDKWVISGLENDISATVRVFDRYGKLLFQSVGYTTPWNGTYKQNKLPAGVYYYLVTAREKQSLSGSVTIIH